MKTSPKNRKKCPDGSPIMIIYCIENKIDQKKYIGQSVNCLELRYGNGTKTFRWWKYVINIHLKNAIRKYGHENFEISILEKDLLSQSELDEKEQFHILDKNTLRPNGYNYVSGGQYVRHNWASEELRNECSLGRTNGRISKILNNLTGEIIEIINVHGFCRDRGIDSSCLSRVIYKEFTFYKIFSLPENPIARTFAEHINGEKFLILDNSMANFCKKYGISQGNVNSVIDGKWKTNKGWSFRRAEKEEYFKYEIFNKDILSLPIKKQEI